MEGDYFSNLWSQSRAAESQAAAEQASAKAVADRAWDEFASAYAVGMTVSAIITGARWFGLLARLDNGIQGWVAWDTVPGWRPMGSRPEAFVDGSRHQMTVVSLDSQKRVVGLAVGSEVKAEQAARASEPAASSAGPTEQPASGFEDPDPFAPAPLDPAERHATLTHLADRVRLSRRGASEERVAELKDSWALLVDADNQDDFYERVAELKRLLGAVVDPHD